jgi:hypothetical protein
VPTGTTASRILSELRAADMPLSEVFLPNRNAPAQIQNGTMLSGAGNSIRFFEPAGTYAFLVDPVSGFAAHPGVGGVVVSNVPASVSIRWA